MSLLPALSVGQTLYLGTYTTTGRGRGIYQSSFDPSTGALTTPVLAAETPDPSFLALHPNGRMLYAVNESDPGAVSSFAMEQATGRLVPLNSQPIAAGSPGPCHLAADPSGRMLLVANYGGGSVAAFPIAPDGRIEPRTALLLHAGGPRTGNQAAPHAHGITFALDHRSIYVPDLGLDRILAYRIDPAGAQLTVAEPASTPLASGSGPRHGEFSPDGTFLYVANELACTVAVFARDPLTGALALRQTVSTLPPDFRGANSVAEIQVHANGRTVFVSNRGHDSLAVFTRDSATGRLAFEQIVPCGGSHPRSFALSPDGAWLVCAHQNSDTLAVFSIDQVTGRLTRTKSTVSVPSPVCVIFAPTSART